MNIPVHELKCAWKYLCMKPGTWTYICKKVPGYECTSASTYLCMKVPVNEPTSAWTYQCIKSNCALTYLYMNAPVYEHSFAWTYLCMNAPVHLRTCAWKYLYMNLQCIMENECTYVCWCTVTTFIFAPNPFTEVKSSSHEDSCWNPSRPLAMRRNHWLTNNFPQIILHSSSGFTPLLMILQRGITSSYSGSIGSNTCNE